MARQPSQFTNRGSSDSNAKSNLPDLGTLDRIEIEAKAYEGFEQTSKEATNALNRQKTQLRNAIKAVIQREDLGPSDEIRVGDTGYRLDVASSEKIDVKTFYNLLKKGDITLDQFLASISVSKDAAKKACGDFIVAKIAVTTPGTKADIRTRDLPVKVAYPEIVRATPVEKNFSPKVGPKLKLRVKPGAAKLMVKRKLGKPKW